MLQKVIIDIVLKLGNVGGILRAVIESIIIV